MTPTEKKKFLLDLIEKYNFYLFPVSTENIPFKGFKWREQSSNSPEIVSEWVDSYIGCNWALDCGKSNICVIDLDRHGKADGVAEFARLIPPGLSSDPELRVATPRNGVHLYYTGQYKSGANVLGPGIDIRSRGGYVALPPSERFGRGYFFLDQQKIKPLPPWIAEKLNAPKEKKKKDQGKIEKVGESAGATQLAIDYLAGAPGAVQGEGGDERTYKVACHLRDLGLAPDSCVALMSSMWNEKCEPPWETDDLENKVNNAYEYGENPVGSKNPEVVFAGMEPPEMGKSTLEPPEVKKSATGKSEDLGKALVHFKDLLDEDAPPREWVIDGWIPAKAGTLFTGQGGAGKSLLSFQLGVSVAYGIPWLGMEVAQSRPVILMLCEDAIDEIHRRAENLYSSLLYSQYSKYATSPSRLAILPRLGKNSRLCSLHQNELRPTKFYQDFLSLLKKDYAGQEPLIILDTVTDVFGLNENDRGLVNQFVKQMLGGLTVQQKATVVTIGHPPKGDAQYSGSTGWDTAYRQRLYLGDYSEEKGKLTNYRKLEVSKANYGARGQALALMYQDGLFVHVDEAGIVDGRQQIDLDTVYQIIQDSAESGNAIGMSAQHGFYLGDLDIRDSLGKAMLLPERRRLVTLLKTQGLVVEVKGKPRSNGLFPQNFVAKEEEK